MAGFTLTPLQIRYLSFQSLSLLILIAAIALLSQSANNAKHLEISEEKQRTYDWLALGPDLAFAIYKFLVQMVFSLSRENYPPPPKLDLILSPIIFSIIIGFTGKLMAVSWGGDFNGYDIDSDGKVQRKLEIAGCVFNLVAALIEIAIWWTSWRARKMGFKDAGWDFLPGESTRRQGEGGMRLNSPQAGAAVPGHERNPRHDHEKDNEKWKARRLTQYENDDDQVTQIKRPHSPPEMKEKKNHDKKSVKSSLQPIPMFSG